MAGTPSGCWGPGAGGPWIEDEVHPLSATGEGRGGVPAAEKRWCPGSGDSGARLLGMFRQAAPPPIVLLPMGINCRDLRPLAPGSCPRDPDGFRQRLRRLRGSPAVFRHWGQHLPTASGKSLCPIHCTQPLSHSSPVETGRQRVFVSSC